jgi:hypothetical protein
MICGNSKSHVSPFHCHIHGYAGAHTHMHMFLQYVHITHKQNKARFRQAQWGSESDHRDDFPASTNVIRYASYDLIVSPFFHFLSRAFKLN